MCFCKRQYPGGVNTNVRQVQGALSILSKWNIEITNNQTFELRVNNPFEGLERVTNSYVYVNGNDNNYTYKKFYENEILKQPNNILYASFVKFLFETNPNKKPLSKILNMSDQISVSIFTELIEKYKPDKIKDVILSLENYNKKTYKSFNLTIRKWLQKDK